MSEMKDFLTALVKNPEAKELLKGLKEPSGAEEAAELYADIAAKTGTSISKDAILAILKEKEAIQQARSAKAEGAVRQALEENDLESVAGGANPGCDDTHSPGEWCWFTDSCEFVISYYDNPACKLDSYNYPVKPKTYSTIEEEFPTDYDSDGGFLNGENLVCPFGQSYGPNGDVF